MNQQELKNILELHRKWVMNEPGGERANLSSANLSSANLRYADLRSANLSSANLSSANLSYANLRYADLRSANLSSANLSSANLSSANLSYADLRLIKDDFFMRLEIAKAEAIGLYDHLMRGKINGSVYEGKCACFIGTIANIRKENHQKLSISLKPESDSPTEKWFLAIKEGDTPSNNSVAQVTGIWLEEFMKANELVIPKYKLFSDLERPDLFAEGEK